ncbi:MAG: hypothetical protein E6Q50_05250 [Lysobacter sp.]|nr:MAG: hypothetical protein E6Q50_05250 [Lysobacter sp.]
MPAALYYPHTDIKNEIILKNSLLLWDKVETITPRENWSPHRFTDKYCNEAVDLIVRNRKPTHDEQQLAHDALLGLYNSGELFKLVAANNTQNRGHYPIYPEKFMGETWRILRQGGMARWINELSDYGVPPNLGFLMMSLLADACAGTQIQKITDRTDAYSWLSESRAQSINSSHIKGLDISQVAPNFERLVTLSLEVLDARNIPIKRLVELRKREAKNSGTDYSAMRRRYAKALQNHVKRICADARNKSDVKELERQFKLELSTDLTDLKAELKLASYKSLFSKEVAVSAALTAGSLISPIAGLTSLGTQIGLVGVIPLIKTAIEFRGARRIAMQKHVSSWLYLGTQNKNLSAL